LTGIETFSPLRSAGLFRSRLYGKGEPDSRNHLFDCKRLYCAGLNPFCHLETKQHLVKSAHSTESFELEKARSDSDLRDCLGLGAAQKRLATNNIP